MSLFLPTIVAQTDLIPNVAGIVAAIVVSFIGITLVASYYRFQHIVQQAEDTDPEAMGASASDVLRVQLARYLAGCARRGTSFTVALVRISNPSFIVRMNSDIINGLKAGARRADVSCVFDDQTAVLLLESEPEDGEGILARIFQALEKSCAGLQAEEIRAGLSSYPGHGLSGKELTEVALSGLENTSAEMPIVMPELIDEDAEDEEDDDEPISAIPEAVVASEQAEDLEEDELSQGKGWKERRKNSMLDELTGVLKPSAVSAFMQRAMSELRRKKQKAALFCIGLNNMDHIARFHGQEAANDVMAGVSKVLQDHLRADDLIGRHERYAYLVLAECSLEEAEIIGKRITTLVQNAVFKSEQKKLKTTITLGVATYPDHGRNLHHLYLAGQKVLDHSRANDIRAYAVYDPELHDKVQTKPIQSIKSIQE